MRYLLLLSLVIASCTTSRKYTPEQISAESVRFNKFIEKAFDRWVMRSPSFETHLGGKKLYHKLNDYTDRFRIENNEFNKEHLVLLEKFNFDALDEQSKISYRLFKDYLVNAIGDFKYRHHYFPINQMFGVHSRLPSFMINSHRVDQESDATAYIARLHEFPRAIDEVIENLKLREQKGIRPPSFIFEKVLRDCRNILSGQPFDSSSKDSSLWEDFKKKTKTLKNKSSLQKNARKALKSSVLPAYKKLITYLEGLEKRSTTAHGAWSLPDGANYYQVRLKRQTTTDLTPDQIHQKGLSEVTRIHAEMNLIKKKVGFEGSLTEFFSYMKSNKEMFYSNDEAGRAAYLKRVSEIVEAMKKKLPLLFNILPKAKLIVKPVEPYRQRSAGIAFYQGPSLTGDRPGTYYINLSDMGSVPKYNMEALTYHESVPGHHMQISIAQELEGLPRFRKFNGFTAYSEGWGLYAEAIPKEIGMYSDPYSDFGRLYWELWRATRMVVDTGIHAKKWSREKSIAYLKENTPNSDDEIVKGVERYFVMPGQATTYKVGMLKIMELRKNAEDALGEKFDIRDFHDVILKNGPLPLYLLEERVASYVRQKQQ